MPQNTASKAPKTLGLGIPFLSAKEIRRSFVDFFASKEHQFVPSAPVVPHDDPTLLFTNAGMNQFKAAFLGDNRLGYRRVANSQKCIRVSGKHNDLDEVGRDTYHHTFFEMLGNWSFGDYYKREAITWAWELLTEVWKLPKDRLFVTVYRTDDEAAELWKSVTDIPPERVMRFDEKDNFWEMGEVGPCGPSSEIHFDMGDASTREATFADPIGGVNGKNDRYIEIWNLVFIQYERLQSGELKPLKSKHVDTGMGFERVCSVIQDTGSNYETDVFRPLLERISELSGTEYRSGPEGTPHRVIADHLRALSFAITDGATPGNEGRGYVLRRILRRASRFARELGPKEPFLFQLVPTLTELMGGAFPELAERRDYVMQVIRAEEERFVKTLDQGLDRFHKTARSLPAGGQVSGEDVFVLYDTYGFPPDLTQMLAEEKGLTVDLEGYERHMNEQRVRARGAAKFDGSLASEEGWTLLDPSSETEFTGYHNLVDTVRVRRYREDEGHWLLVLDKTPFYAEAGGQVGDIGSLSNNAVDLEVVDTFKILEMTVHKCRRRQGDLDAAASQPLKAQVDRLHREATFRNHSATHLLQAALQKVLGDHVRQQGSKVDPEGLRFDFTHHHGMSEDDIRAVEDLVNARIQENLEIAATECGYDEAKAMGAMALFGEKYGDKVRTIQMGEFSLELCGGTHASSTGQVGFFKIISESSVAAGIRRIEAVTGPGALKWVRRQSESLAGIGKALKAKPGQEALKVEELSLRVKGLEKEIQSLRQEQAGLKAGSLVAQAEDIGGAPCLILSLEKGFDKNSLSALADGLAPRMSKGVAVLTLADSESLTILTLVGKELQGRLKAGDLVKELSRHADGKGGGRPDRAQAGSKSPEKEAVVLEEARKLLKQALAA